jgi:hypothetical protein
VVPITWETVGRRIRGLKLALNKNARLKKITKKIKGAGGCGSSGRAP